MQDIQPQLHQLGYKDKAWSVNKLGSIAYRHQLPEMAISAINTLYGHNSMEVQEAFVKIKAQAKAYLLLPGDLNSGLHLLHTLNLDYFNQVRQRTTLQTYFLDTAAAPGRLVKSCEMLKLLHQKRL